MTFTIRDLMWATVLVALALGWFIQIRIERQRFAEREEESRVALNKALNDANSLKYGVRVGEAKKP